MATKPWIAGLGPCLQIEKVSIKRKSRYLKILLNPDSAYNCDITLFPSTNIKEIELDMPFTKQHFVQTATILKESKIPEESKQELFLDFSKAYGSLNPDFDSDRFYAIIFPSTSGVSQ